jgi:hypothetical protein
MSLREFGRSVDKTGEAVRKAIATGKIPADCVGERKLKTGPGRMVPVIINPQRAAKCWGQNVDPNQVRDKRVMSESRAAAHARARGEEPKPRTQSDPDIEVPELIDGQVPPVAVSKAITAHYEAKDAKIAHEQKVGKLVDAEQIRLRYFGMIKTAQTKLRGVPTKAKGQIPTLTVRDIEILEELIDEAMKELADGR